MPGKPLYSLDALLELQRQTEGWDKDNKTNERYFTNSGIEVKPFYSLIDLKDFEHSKLGLPGDSPYTRGIHSTMYRTQPWTIRQLAGFGSAEDTNQRYRFLIENGATGINGVFDYPTLRGYNSNDPVAICDLGQGGVAIDTIEDMHLLFEGIPLDKVSVSLVLCNPIATVTVFAMYLAMAQERGIPWEKLRGTNQNDFLMETTVSTAPVSLQPHFSFRLSTDVVEFCTNNVPSWYPISYAGYNYREAGVNAIQEVGLVIANAVATIEEMIKRGYNIDSFAPRLSMFFSSDTDFFEEVAKYRAARRVWHNLTTKKYAAQNKKSQCLKFHVQTSGASLTPQQPLNNITRSTLQALAAVLGGAQSIHVNGYDEALAIPTEESAITALRTQQILLNEANIALTVDPLGGSFYIESLTNELEERIEALLKIIEDKGGIVAAVEQGWVKNEIMNSAYEHFNKVQSGERKIVGLNCFKSEEETTVDIFRTPDARQRQIDRLASTFKTRNSSIVEKDLEKIRFTCMTSENIFPYILTAVKNRVSLGEICDIFREVKGGWKVLF
jgi:methylmalonyl-CoA mutase, N-terminal domain